LDAASDDEQKVGCEGETDTEPEEDEPPDETVTEEGKK